eukprot:TRINITY_DN3737_c0_g1_i1.p1 TRINITY_DN3737_c0_g1~~TRINITY_DN3737_c0_g1_i1.p1  ORF type:complete len:397 (-),score=95.41 TRINITY_DN3737_c0_g1_i1:99-1289(-)
MERYFSSKGTPKTAESMKNNSSNNSNNNSNNSNIPINNANDNVKPEVLFKMRLLPSGVVRASRHLTSTHVGGKIGISEDVSPTKLEHILHDDMALGSIHCGRMLGVRPGDSKVVLPLADAIALHKNEDANEFELVLEHQDASLDELLEIVNRKHALLQSRRALASDRVEALFRSLSIRYVWSTNALEGNTISLEKAQELLERGIPPLGSDTYDVRETLNGQAAFSHMEQFIDGKPSDLDCAALSAMHCLMMDTLHADAGSFRSAPVFISGAGMVPPGEAKVPAMMEKLLEDVAAMPEDDPSACIALASKLMHRFTAIHPYSDGNGRMSRLFFTALTLQQGHPLAIFHPLSRRVYLDSLTHADKGNYEVLYRYTLERVNAGLDQYLDAVSPVVDKNV